MQSARPWTACSFVVAPVRDYPFYITAKRYFPDDGTDNSADGSESDVRPVTLLFLHSTSFHKEVYEPTLEELLAIVRRKRDTRGHSQESARLRISEIWAIDCPNHGEAAILNYELLRQPEYKEYCELCFCCDECSCEWKLTVRTCTSWMRKLWRGGASLPIEQRRTGDAVYRGALGRHRGDRTLVGWRSYVSRRSALPAD